MPARSPLVRRAEHWLAPAALLGMAAAWGSTFFLIKDLLLRVPAYDLLALRFTVAAVVLGLLGLGLGGRGGLRLDRTVLRGGVGLGVLYAGGQILQTVGLAHTSASVSGFITGLYVVATPLLGALLFRARVTALTWAAVGLATVGLGVLSLHGFSVGLGEALTLGSAVVYAGHIVATGRVSRPDRVLGLAFVQLVTIAAICWLAAVPDGVQLPQRPRDWAALLYLAVVAGALALFLQTWAQARVSPTRAAVIMAMEPVFAAGFAVLAGGEQPTVRMLVGGAAVLTAMYLVEVGPWLGDRRRRVRTIATTAAEVTPGSATLDAPDPRREPMERLP